MRLHLGALLAASCGLLSGCLERRDGDTSAAQNACATCHGDPSNFSDALLAAAPPYNLAGESNRTARGNGAHRAHLLGSDSSRKLECSECHRVPSDLYSQGHVDTSYPAEVQFRGPATAFEAPPVFDADSGTCKNTFCHGGYFVGGRPSNGTRIEPAWLDDSGEPAACGACHSLPPPAPHPPENTCSDCHRNIEEDRTFSRPDLHVDGLVTFNLPKGD